jgi:uncharacterized protein (DUF433 family)
MDIYGGKDPRDFPVYSVQDAARYLGVPVPTLRTWVTGRGRQEPVIWRPPGASALSFTNLVEAYVLSAMRRKYKIPLQRIRPALQYVEQRIGVDRPLAHQDFQAHGAELFVQHLGDLHCVTKPGQIAMKEVLDSYLERIERDSDGVAARIFLFARSGPSLDQPRVVLVDPRRAWGRPMLASAGVPVDAVIGRYKAGEDPTELADDYGCTVADIMEVIRWEIRRAA